MLRVVRIIGLELALLILVYVVLALIPLTGQRFYIYLGSLFMIYAIFALSYNVLFGYARLVSFGHGLFFAWGAYATALTTLNLYRDPLVGVLVGIVTALIPSLVVGFLTVRHTRIYFAILTLAFGMVFYSALVKLRWLTGGTDGLVGIPKRGVILDISSPQAYYYFILAFFIVSTLLLYAISRSSIGLLIRALGGNEERLPFLGYSVFQLRLVAFTISGVGSALAGSLYAILMGVVTPDISYWTFSAEPLIMCLVGGFEHFMGPLVGAFVIVVLTTIAARFYEVWMLVLGLMVIGIVLAFRGGFTGFLETTWNLARHMVVARGGASKS